MSFEIERRLKRYHIRDPSPIKKRICNEVIDEKQWLSKKNSGKGGQENN